MTIKLSWAGFTLGLLALSACGAKDGDGAIEDLRTLYVSSTSPGNNSTNIATNTKLSIVFSTRIVSTTISSTSFTLFDTKTQLQIAGQVSSSGNTALFSPSFGLTPSREFHALVKKSVRNLSGKTLVKDYTWKFTTGEQSDTTPPKVSSVTPINQAKNVATNTKISVVFTESIDPFSISSGVVNLVSADGSLISGQTEQLGRTVIFTPTSVLQIGVTYTASISRVKDLRGNAMVGSYQWSFTTQSESDTTRPVVSSVTPLPQSKDVPINGKVSVTFSEVVDIRTLTTYEFFLTDSSSRRLVGNVSVLGRVATFTPLDLLPEDSRITAHILSSVSDLAGNTLESDYIWEFTTSAQQDLTAPQVSNHAPGISATDVSISSKFSVTFTEPMLASSLTSASFLVEKANGVLVIGTITNTGRTSVFSPLFNLDPETKYKVTILRSVKDLNGNELESDYSWSFTTASTVDSTPPEVSLTAPEPDALQVSTITKVTATFSENITPTSVTPITFYLKEKSNQKTVNGVVSAFGRSAIFTPSEALSYSTTYECTLKEGILDLSGNALANDFVWSFTTGAAPDTTRPELVSTVPLGNQSNVDVNTKILAVFSEDMAPSTVNTLSFTLKDLNSNAISGIVSYSSRTAIFTPSANLNFSVTYTASIRNTVRDLSGNSMLNDYSWTFTTGVEADTTPPFVQSISPADNTVSVATSTKILIAFSEDMNPNTINTGTIQLKLANTSISGTVGYTNKVATFTPLSALKRNSTYTVTVTQGVKDLASNPMTSSFTSMFKTK
ncbi:MAG: Ig-like domain-containing protein [Deltaproteobacteria bacterium]|nr:Ig-like domain-containing protein [Deltaproteobacteria bacterium]